MKASINDDPAITAISPNTTRAGDKINIHIGVNAKIPKDCTNNQIFKYTITPSYNNGIPGQSLIDTAPFAQDGKTNTFVSYFRAKASPNSGSDADVVAAMVQDNISLSKTNYTSRKTIFYPKIESLIGAAGDDTKSVSETIYPNQISSVTSTITRLTPVDPANRRPRVNDTVAYILTAKGRLLKSGI